MHAPKSFMEQGWGECVCLCQKRKQAEVSMRLWKNRKSEEEEGKFVSLEDFAGSYDAYVLYSRRG